MEDMNLRSRLWTPEDLASFLGLENTKWIYERTRVKSADLIPHYKLGKYLRFDPNSPEFQQWLSNHKMVRQIDNPSGRS